MILLVGLPGSGKSRHYIRHYDNYVYINQDTLGTRDKCIKACEEALRKKQSVIIDRCNFNREQRKYFIDLALEYGVKSIKAIWLFVPEEECIARINIRKNHPTIPEELSLEKKMEIVFKLNKLFEPPTMDEPLSEIQIIRNY